MSQPRYLLSEEEYLAKERAADFKSEFYAGEMFAMAGASRKHNVITNNLGGELRARLRDKPCEVYTSDMRVKVTPTGLYTYPDVVVACDKPEFEDAEVDTLLNPRLIAEVLSESTRDYDRGGKSNHYRQIPSLLEYLIVNQAEINVELLSRQADGSWRLTETRDRGAVIHLESLDCEVPVEEIYAKVAF